MFLHETLRTFHVIDLITVITQHMPKSENVEANSIVIVGGKDWSKWALLKCPCGCGDLITMSLMKSHDPYWRIKLDFLKRVTLSPSVWKNDGCRSHFFIKKGKLSWARE